jgi:hypothetical protein
MLAYCIAIILILHQLAHIIRFVNYLLGWPLLL